MTILLVSLVDCGGTESPTDTGEPQAPVATTIVLSSTTLVFSWLGEIQQLTATVADQNGAAMSGASVTWSSSDAGVASLSSSGLVTAVANGTATITATSGSASARASATVAQAAASITLAPDSLVLDAPGDTATILAMVMDAGGSEIVSPSLTWSSSDQSTVTVNSSGLVTAVASGPASVTAQAGDLQAGISARVKGASLSAMVTGDGDPLPGVDVWLTRPTGENTKRVTNSEGMALFRNLLAGTHTVTLQNTPAGLRPLAPQVVEVKEDQGVDVTFSGVFTPAQLVGEANAWGRPVVGARVSLVGKDTVQITVDGTGAFRIDSIRPGAYTATISEFSEVRFKETTLRFDLEPGSEHSLTFVGRPNPEPQWVSISSGSRHTCGLTVSGIVYCWGLGVHGYLGNGRTETSATPFEVAGDQRWRSVSAGGNHSCGLTTDGTPYCWGRNDFGQYGDGTTSSSLSPVRVAGNNNWALLSAGGNHTCGVETDGDANCWGRNVVGQLGNGGTTQRLVPGPVSGGHRFNSIAPGGEHVCGVSDSAELYCWGQNANGQLGDGSTTVRLAPTKVQGGFEWSGVGGSVQYSCGLTTSGLAYCWGQNVFGQLGDGTTTDRSVPAPVSGNLSFVGITVGGQHACGVTSFGEAYCWGLGQNGRLGNGQTQNSSVPERVAGGHTWASIDAGANHTCGVTVSGEGHCWGDNSSGSLGNEFFSGDRRLPSKIGGTW